ncbi:hypothetical protein [Alteromonas sp. OM2203]|uniref:hypothetical protein n=1 Tax=Alteromonas sp. OM2203 TaxID=3398817 RepID=UPI003AF3C952
MLDSGVPDNCAGVSNGWMLIKQQDVAITSLVLAVWTSEKKVVTVYTHARENNMGDCVISQFDPAG